VVKNLAIKRIASELLTDETSHQVWTTGRQRVRRIAGGGSKEINGRPNSRTEHRAIGVARGKSWTAWI
jgi:hypothetical protein